MNEHTEHCLKRQLALVALELSKARASNEHLRAQLHGMQDGSALRDAATLAEWRTDEKLKLAEALKEIYAMRGEDEWIKERVERALNEANYIGFL